MSKPKILITWPLKKDQFDKWQEEFQIDVLNNYKNRRAEVLDRIAEYHGLLNMSIDINREVLERASNLKIVANYGVGYDNIDVYVAQELGVAVSNTPESTTIPTANHAIGLMLSLLRKISEHDRRLKSRTLENWYKRKELGNSIEGKHLGLIGMGRIGKAVATRAKALGMKVSYYKRTPLTKEEEEIYDTSYMDLKPLLSSCDIVSIHTPLTGETNNLISKQELDLMSSSSFLINTARGGIINEDDLISHLKDGKICGAALDVFQNEPNLNPKFLDLENVILTPHSGTGTHEARANMMSEALGNIMAYLKGEKMTSRIV